MSQLKTLTKSESYLLGLLASSANNNPSSSILLLVYVSSTLD